MLSLVIETPSSWNGNKTLFKTSGTDSIRYIYYSGNLQNNTSSYVPGITLNTNTFYLITHIIDRGNGNETFRVKKNGQTVQIYTSYIATSAGRVGNHMFGFSGAVTPLCTFKRKVGESIITSQINVIRHI